MKANITKFLPYAFGGLIGWLLAAPPEWFRSFGIAGYFLLGLLCMGLLISFLLLIILQNLPEDIVISPAPGETPPDVAALGNRLVALGFKPVGPALQVEVSPPALLTAFISEEWSAYSTIFRTGTVPARTAFDFVTVFEGGRMLTTLAEPGGEAMPLVPGNFRQVFPGAGIEELFSNHTQGVVYLHNLGLYRRPATAAAFLPDFKSSFSRQRKCFLESPFLNTIKIIWRVAAKQIPHRGPLAARNVRV